MIRKKMQSNLWIDLEKKALVDWTGRILLYPIRIVDPDMGDNFVLVYYKKSMLGTISKPKH